MKSKGLILLFGLGLVTLFGLGLVAGLAGCNDQPYRAPAPSATSERELPGTSSENDLGPVTAQQYVDDVRLGRGVDAQGAITDQAETFRTDDSVHIGMEVTDAPAGSAIRVSVNEVDSDAPVWTAERAVPAGSSHMHFSINEGNLPRGKYRAKVIIGDETVAERDFEVS